MSNERFRALWDGHAASYDRQTLWLERRLLGSSRPWVCSRASGRVLELGIGTGLNLPYYSADVALTGLDWSPRMLDQARDAAARLRRPVELVPGDAVALPFADGTFDTVLSTYLLCSVADVRVVLAEARRVLVPGGRLLLADHVAPASRVLRLGARLVERVTVPSHNEYLTRRPLEGLEASGFRIVETERAHWGVSERVHAAAV
ncbi:class I SAM-dependent methyltransferase [Propioniciclava tarda]|uniref:Class I SAM-dependent methyltransferase n=1 Tax=Propioniciclava tarda TaxID=433330 RepID=A0A4Q9KJM2_PROTD|nr:class I SAM-dependent methyltransferase [Propioniciclava tarda]TBT94646.1 class I SAM-dependent methyltransferase [Propioniciclava tarda]SMO66962.1 phosphatidylethanolamine N-methyltransferase /phosphatidyl-N-methylethanolamine N-methyltransferase [Propioniciclava tarda]HOA90008.1 class I SAM-dependent methyltransferase [Propioniciclava tarda]HQA30291.1 class I SAM-dependent methyltransferase [Propioniciclava tarda]HQD61506.1 class I SAM-dependent methyltransferase [Propioniciclava tarda]